MPPGDPEALDQAAASIGRVAAGVGDLATATHQVTAGIVADAEWTGQAADACTAFTSGLTRGVGNIHAPLARIPTVIGGYAAALRGAQTRVAAYQGYANQAGPGVMTDPATLTGLESDAGAALAALEQAAQVARAGLDAIAAELAGVFDASGPFRAWLEKAMLPWDGTSSDAVLEHFIEVGEAAEKDAEESADFMKELPGKLDAWFSDMVGGVMQDMLAGKAGVSELAAMTDRWQSMRAAADAFGQQWSGEPPSLLARLLPGMKVLGGAMGGLAVVGGIYTLISPPGYDKGTLRIADRTAGVGAIASGATAVAVNAGVNFSEIVLAGQSLDFVPGLGEVVGVGTGLYLAGDYIYHNTHQIAHAYDAARHAVAGAADDMGHAAAQSLGDLTGGLL
jgi:hypothetical protein